MPSMNKVFLIGRLVRDPELRYTSSGLAVTSFTIAVDRRFKDQQTGERKTDFFRCTAWRQKAEFVQQYVHKGRLVAVEGSIELNEYTAQDGTRRTSPDVQCENIETLDAARDGEGGGQGGNSNGGGAAQSGGASGGEYFDDDVNAAPARSQGGQGGGQGGNARPAPQRSQAPAQASAPAAARPQVGAPQGGRSQAAAPAGAKGGAAPQPGYPQNDYDFDDSDPFADE